MNRREFILAAGAAGLLQSRGVHAGRLLDDVKIGTTLPGGQSDNGVNVWVSAFVASIEAGGISSRVFPNSTIGGERERLLQTQMGLLTVNVTGGDEIARWSPMAAASARPFLMDSYDHYGRVLTTTRYLETISDDLAPYGLRLIDFAYTASMVGLFTRGSPVRRVAELRPLRLRVLSEADMHLLRGWNVRGVQVAWEEVAQALQTGIVDAYLNPPNVAPMFGHGSVLDYFTDLRMGPAVRPIVVSLTWFDSLSAADRRIVEHGLAMARQANRAWAAEAEKNDRENLEKTGIEWISLTAEERGTWIEASRRIEPSSWEEPSTTEIYLSWVDACRPEPQE